MKFETQTIHAGQEPDPETGAVMTPIYQTSTYKQEGVGKHKGYEYSRTDNPTRNALERNLAALERGKFCAAFSSGMAAIDTILRLLGPGDHILAGNDVYGGTYRLFETQFRRFGLEITYLDTTKLEQIAAQIRPNTRMVWLESPTNPLLGVSDIRGIAEIAHSHRQDMMVVVDNTFATPYLQRPLELGADIVVHSTTKYLGGHSDVIGGAMVTNHAEIYEQAAFLQNAVGAVPGPMDCFLVLRGIKTLHVRMDRHAKNANAIAEFLSSHSRVDRIYYPFHPAHPQVETAKKQMRNGGGIVSFTVSGGAEAARKVAEGTKIIALAESLGGVESLIEVPALMTHLSTSDSPLAVSPSLVRLSVGLEHVDDLISDLETGLSL